MAQLTTHQAAERLGVTPSRIRQMILAGQLPAEKIGRDWIIASRHLNKIKRRPVGRPPKS